MARGGVARILHRFPGAADPLGRPAERAGEQALPARRGALHRHPQARQARCPVRPARNRCKRVHREGLARGSAAARRDGRPGGDHGHRALLHRFHRQGPGRRDRPRLRPRPGDLPDDRHPGPQAQEQPHRRGRGRRGEDGRRGGARRPGRRGRRPGSPEGGLHPRAGHGPAAGRGRGQGGVRESA